MKLNLNPTAVRFLAVLAITVGAWGAYRTFLVPIVEAPIQKTEKHKTETSTNQELPYAQFFEEGAWERNPESGHLLRSNNIVMFFKDLSMDETMKVRSKECTILIAPGETTFPIEKRVDKPFYPIKVSIHEGAEIQFSSKEDKVNPRPLGGRLLGPVTISYKMQMQGHWVDCIVKTSDLFCNMQSLQTSRPVRLMIGPLSMEGSQFKLLFEKSSNDQQLFAGIRSIQMGHLEHITLRINPIMLQQMKLKMTPGVQERLRQMFGNQMEIPIRLKCNGPMIYDVPGGKVQFTQNVVLSCDYPGASPDRLTCGELELRLDPGIHAQLMNGETKRPAATAGTAALAGTAATTETATKAGTAIQENAEGKNVQTGEATSVASAVSGEAQASDPPGTVIPLETISAKQKVTLNIPSLQCTANTENLTFYVRNLQLQISGDSQSTIQIQQNKFDAFDLSYTFQPENLQALGTVQSDQKGRLVTYFEGRGTEPPQELTLEWTGKLLGKPREKGRYDVQVAGKVEASSALFGKITADAFSARMRPRTPEDDQSDLNLAQAMDESLGETGSGTGQTKEGSQMNYLPELLMAQGNVNLEVKQGGNSLNAYLTNIEFEFEKPATLPPELKQIKKTEAQRVSGDGTSQNQGFAGGGILSQNSSSGKEANLREFSLYAGDLKGKILLLPGKEGFFVREVSLEGAGQFPIQLREDTRMVNSEQAVALQARKVFLHDLHPETLQCEISGEGAFLAGLGVRLESTQMALNCAANKISINGAGKMSVFLRQKAGERLNYFTMTETSISWQKGLSFDGHKIEAKDQVQVKMGSTSLRADVISADLVNNIQLSSPPQISSTTNLSAIDFFQNISAEHNVLITHKNFTPEGDLSDVFMLSTHLLNFFPKTMTVQSSGAGYLRLSSLGLSNPGMGNVLGQKTPPTQEPDSNAASEKEWFQVLMEYGDGITGKLAEMEFSINGRISALAHPVPGPEYMISETRIDQRKIPKKGFQVRCEEIFVNQIPEVQNGSFQSANLDGKKVEMQAKGNVFLEQTTLTIEGSLLKYSLGKETCLIEGEPNHPVYLIDQKYFGGHRNEVKARNVILNLETNEYKLDGIEVDGLLFY